MATCVVVPNPKIFQFHNSYSLPPTQNHKSSKAKAYLRKPILARSSNGQEPSSTSSGSGAVALKEKKSNGNAAFPGKPEADVVVIGSGIAGLCCGGLLARYQQDVLVVESHDIAGGAAHSFDIKGYKFDSGPSLFSGFQSRGRQANPLAQVLDALGERIPCASYDSWMVYVPEGEFLSRIGPTEFFKDLEKHASPNAVREWQQLLMQLFNRMQFFHYLQPQWLCPLYPSEGIWEFFQLLRPDTLPHS